MIEENKRVLLGMSGGTDSSVAAMRLLEAGYEVIGVTFRFYELNGSTEYLEDARNLAERLGIRHITYDAREIFARQIIEYFVQEYLAGRTPVPCTLCNNYLKWPLLAKIADEMGVFYIATGHYAQNIQLNETFYITYAADSDKDQTFFLWGLKQDILNRMLLPMGDITKAEARAWAAEHGFRKVATKKDSIGVCFCPMDYRTFLKDWLVRNGQMSVSNSEASINNSQTSGSDKQAWSDRIRRGRFVDEKGTFIAWHEGYPFYTIGQRRGLGIHLNRTVFGKKCDYDIIAESWELSAHPDGPSRIADGRYRGMLFGDYLSITVVPQGYTDRWNSQNHISFTDVTTVAWENGSNKLQKIITQKWIANYPLGIEAWCDYRRTGYPELFTARDNLSSVGYIGDIDSKRMVRRLPYPTTEKSSNSANVEAAIATMLGGPDTGATDLWWAKKN